MRLEQADDHIHCATCGHEKQIHMQVCGDRDCDCLCFLPATGEPVEEGAPLVLWQENVLMAVIDHIIEEREGDILAKTRNGTECIVKVRFVPEIGYMVKGGLG